MTEEPRHAAEVGVEARQVGKVVVLHDNDNEGAVGQQLDIEQFAAPFSQQLDVLPRPQ